LKTNAWVTSDLPWQTLCTIRMLHKLGCQFDLKIPQQFKSLM
jgi:hypothetical protein